VGTPTPSSQAAVTVFIQLCYDSAQTQKQNVADGCWFTDQHPSHVVTC